MPTLGPSLNGSSNGQITLGSAGPTLDKPGATPALAIDEEPEFLTGPQVNVMNSGGRNISEGKGKTPTKETRLRNKEAVFDAMMRDPTIKLAIDIVVAMIKRVPWSVEGDVKEQCDHVYEQFNQYKDVIVRSAIRGSIRHGWRAFEVAFGTQSLDAYTVTGVKPLKNSLTQPLAYEDTGMFAGVTNKAVNGREEIEIDEEHVIFCNFEEDGFGDLGEPGLMTALGPYIKHENCDEGAQRYDKKVAGGLVFIQYPEGQTQFNGAKTDTGTIATAIAKSFQAAGYAVAPLPMDPDTGEPLEASWKVEHVSAGGGLQPNFIVRLKYLDALKLRAFGLPERSTTEGTLGTKAEAEAHADIAILVNMSRAETIVDAINNVLEPMNLACYGDKKATQFVLGKLDPADRELFAEIFKALMADPMFGAEITQRIDASALLDKLNVPAKSTDEMMMLTEMTLGPSLDLPADPGAPPVVPAPGGGPTLGDPPSPGAPGSGGQFTLQ